MNQNGKAISISSGYLNKNKIYCVYAITSTYGKSSDNPVQPILQGKGRISCLMLENGRNRFIYQTNNHPSTLYITDLVEKNHACQATSIPIAERKTLTQFSKIVCLGNNTYLGLTQGTLRGIWLDAYNIIHYAKQKCLSKKGSSNKHLLLQDIAIDNTVVTAKGFHPKVALLTHEGDIYITHLCAHERIVLYHVAKCDLANHHRFYYHNNKIIISYQNGDNIIELPDNFEFLYLRSLLEDEYTQLTPHIKRR